MRIAILLPSLLPSLLLACSLSPRPDTSRYFTLPEPPAAGAPVAGVAPVATFGLGPVAWPPHLSRPELATRIGASQVSYASNDRWAGPLEDLTLRALADELRVRVPAREVVRWPWPLGSPPAVSATVEFTRFEAPSAGGATLVARWTVTASGRAPVTGETRATEPGPPGDAPASVAALGRLLGRLADDLAAASRLPPGR